jgi:uncharacterized protein (DUF433 family)
MSEIMPINYIEKKPNSDKYRIVGKGVTVEFLSTFIDDPDWPMNRICDNYNLTPAEVYAAWSFYADHQVEIDQHLANGEARMETYFREHPERDSRRDQLHKQHQPKRD